MQNFNPHICMIINEKKSIKITRPIESIEFESVVPSSLMKANSDYHAVSEYIVADC